jgi:hypothetical protein
MNSFGKKHLARMQRGWVNVRALNDRQIVLIRRELSQAKGLIPLLMKKRNGGRWSREERAMLLRDLRALSNLSPYLIPILMPGGIFLLPLLAYWMDRRRSSRQIAHKSS